ncbi:MAG: hypothetical protein U0528_20600 [Anaerolineae bacterium]
MASLLRVGAVQFGRFEQKGLPGEFLPLSLRLDLLPSYPALLTALAKTITPTTLIDGVTHLLAMASVISLGTLVSVFGGMPLVYPLHGEIAGAYDFNVPTVLLTDVLSDGVAELALLRQAKREGLDVHAVISVFDFGRQIEGLNIERRCWQTISQLLDESQRSGKLNATVDEQLQRWLG